MDKDENIDYKEFGEGSAKQWKEKIQADLKGADYDQKLSWSSVDGIKLDAVYTDDSLSALKHLQEGKRFGALKAGTANKWLVRLSLTASNITADQDFLKSLPLDRIDQFSLLGTTSNLLKFRQTLLDIIKQGIPVILRVQDSATTTNPDFREFLTQNKGLNILTDPLSDLFWETNREWDKSQFSFLVNLVKSATLDLSPDPLISLKANSVLDAGGNNIQQIAFALALASEYFVKLEEKSLKTSHVSRLIEIHLGAGPDYFAGIASIRAMRLLWSQLLKAYGVEPGKFPARIHCSASSWNQTVLDPENNLLRSTTEAMSSIIGGCDSLDLLPYDAPFRQINEFSTRIAQNIQLILKNESFLDKVSDPAGGSYYVESLTDQMATAAWDLFRQIEADGGFLKSHQNGTLMDLIKATREEQYANFEDQKCLLIGTNKHAAPVDDTIRERILRAQAGSGKGDSTLNLQQGHRLSEKFEANLLNQETNRS